MGNSDGSKRVVINGNETKVFDPSTVNGCARKTLSDSALKNYKFLEKLMAECMKPRSQYYDLIEELRINRGRLTIEMINQLKFFGREGD